MKAKLIVHTGIKGGEGSGFFKHAGRPGKIGGSGAAYIAKLVDFIEDLKTVNDTQAYYITAKDKLLDAAQDIEGGPGGKHHGGVLTLGNAGKILGLTDPKFEVLKGLPNQRSEEYDKILKSNWDKGIDIDSLFQEAMIMALEKGAVRVNVGRGNTNIQTGRVDDSTLSRLQDLFYNRKLVMNDTGKHWWSDVWDTIAKRFTRQEFLQANHITDLPEG